MASTEGHHGTEKHSPLEQFEISPFVHFETGIGDLAFTNSSLINGNNCYCNYFIFNPYS